MTGDRQDVAGAAPPDKVSSTAAQRRPGSLVMSQRDANPIASSLTCLAVAGGLAGIEALLVQVTRTTGVDLHSVAVLLVAPLIVAVLLAFRALLAGSTAAYLYEWARLHQELAGAGRHLAGGRSAAAAVEGRRPDRAERQAAGLLRAQAGRPQATGRVALALG